METYMNLSNEDRMLLYCGQTEISETTRSRIKALVSSPLNWDNLLDSAYWHGVAPLLYHNIKQMGEGNYIPPDLLNKLKNTYYENLAKNMYLYSELGKILEAFNQNGIKVIVLKGAALAEAVYGDIALRPMNDIDLMVKKEDLPTAEKIMSDLGYTFAGKELPEWYRENHFHVGYLSPDKSILVELHWHIARKSHPSRIAIIDSGLIEGFWERAKTSEIAGTKALVLCPEDLLLHLSLHFLKHRFMSNSFRGTFTNRNALIQLCDISQILKHYGNEINWTRLEQEADKHGIKNLVFSIIHIAEELGSGESVCHENSNGPNPENLDCELLELIHKKILAKEERIPAVFFQSLAADSYKLKVRILLDSLFPQPSVLARKYSLDPHSLKFYLYYLFRPLGVLIKHARLIRKFWGANKEIREEVILSKWINSRN